MNIALDYVHKIVNITSGKQKEYWVWLLENGQEFTFNPLAKETEKELRRRLGRPLFKPKECYYASQIIATYQAGVNPFRYYEGFASTEKLNFAFEHGFLVSEGKIFDPTWRDGKEYFGVFIPNDFIRNQIVKTGVAGAILSRYYLEQKQVN